MSIHKSFTLFALFILLLASCTSLIKPRVKTELRSLKGGEFVLDTKHASLLFKVKHLDLSYYIGRFNRFEANLSFDPEKLEETRLEAVVDVASVDSNDEELESTLKSSGWFDVERYPQAYFSTESVEVLEDDSFIFTGILEWRDERHPIQLKAVFLGGANNILTGKYTLGFTATGKMLRSQFGVDKYLGLVADEITLNIDAEFQKTSVR